MLLSKFHFFIIIILEESDTKGKYLVCSSVANDTGKFLEVTDYWKRFYLQKKGRTF